MNLGEFIKEFSHNNIIRLHYKVKGGYKSVLASDNDVSMDWEILKAKGNNRHFIKNKVLGVVSILYMRGHYTEAINIAIEKLDNQPFINEIKEEIINSESSVL